jgi:hypothetical protein
MVTPTRDNIYTGLSFIRLPKERMTYPGSWNRCMSNLHSIISAWTTNRSAQAWSRCTGPLTQYVGCFVPPTNRRLDCLLGGGVGFCCRSQSKSWGFASGWEPVLLEGAHSNAGKSGADLPDVHIPTPQQNLFLVKCRLSTCSSLYTVERRTRATKRELNVFYF